MQNFIKIQLQYLNLKCKSIYNCTEICRLVNNELWKLYFVKIVRYISPMKKISKLTYFSPSSGENLFIHF